MKKAVGPILLFVLLGCIITVVFPFFAGRGTYKARQYSCISNERQIGLALIQYENDNDLRLPSVVSKDGRLTWRYDLLPYVGDLKPFACPDRIDVQKSGPDGIPNDYGANASRNALFGPPGSWGVSLSKSTDPENLIDFCDTEGPGASINIDDRRTVRSGPSIWAGHHGGANFQFADGHVKWMDPASTADYKATGASKPVNLWYVNGSTPLSAAGHWRLAHPATEQSPL